jgi:hypothetical protein
MAKPKSYLIHLEENDLGQVIDGIEARATAWRETAEFLKTGVPPHTAFSAEECLDDSEAENLAACYDRILDKIRQQRGAQRARFPEPKSEQLLDQPGAAFAIYINTLCDGPVPVERNEAGLPFVYHAAAEAEHVIAESIMERLNEYFAGERAFDDATTVEEYAVPVQLHPDGSITDENGNRFPNPEW